MEEERFAKLFRGYTKRYGQYTLAGDAVEGEKRAGRAKTVDGALTQLAFTRHVAGDVGIGVIPLTEDNRVHFCALDIDVYKLDDQRTKSLTHQDIATALIGDPLIVTRSKSNGIHVWLFSEDGASAAVATQYLESIAARLGVSGCEVFPKQTERVHAQDVGNWINLPYFGGARNAVVPNDVNGVRTMVEATLEQFLALAEGAASGVTDEWLIANTPVAVDQRDKSDELPLWFDGPPCLQSLMVGHPERVAKIDKQFKEGLINEDQRKKQMALTGPQMTEGGRNETLFNVGLYLRRRMFERDPDQEPTLRDREVLQDSMNDAHNHWCGATGLAGVSTSELKAIGAQSFKGKWAYACNKQPLKQFCNRRTCLKRRLGVGTGKKDNTTDITDFTVIKSEKRQYAFNVGTTRVYIPDIGTLRTQSRFAEAVMNATDTNWSNMRPAEFDSLLDSMFSNMREEEPLRGLDDRDLVLETLHDFVVYKRQDMGKHDDSFHSGRVIWEDETWAYFKFTEFFQFFLCRYPDKISRNQLSRYLKEDFGVTTKMKRFGPRDPVNAFVVDIAQLDSLAAGMG